MPTSTLPNGWTPESLAAWINANGTAQPVGIAQTNGNGKTSNIRSYNDLYFNGQPVTQMGYDLSAGTNTIPGQLLGFGQTNNLWTDAQGNGITLDQQRDLYNNFSADTKPKDYTKQALALAAIAGGGYLFGPEILAALGGDAAAAGGATALGEGGSLAALNGSQLAALENAASGLVAPIDFSSTLGAVGGAGGAGTLAGSLSVLGPEQIAAMQNAAAGLSAPIDFSSTLSAGAGAGGAGALTDAALKAASDTGAFESGFEGSNVIKDAAANGTLSTLGSGLSLSSIADTLGGAKGLATLAGAALGGISSATTPDSTTSTQQSKLDPRMDSILYGADGKTGLLNDIAAQAKVDANAGLKTANQAYDNYVGLNAGTDLSNLRTTANSLAGSNIANPTMSAAQVNAPSQNSLDLKSSYDNFINGNAGANPYLTNALQSAVNQTNASYQKNQTDLTNNLTRNVLPNIRSGAIGAGQYGGSRQGIAEGNALSDYTNQLGNYNLQLGLANSANTTSQQANAFNQGQDRSLNALNSLGAQQYGLATNNAQLQQQANANNLQSQISTNNLNSQNQIAGLAAGSGLLNNAMTQANNANNYTLNRQGTVSGLLSPFTGLNSTSSNTQPVYSNTAGSLLGGALTGASIYKNLFGG